MSLLFNTEHKTLRNVIAPVRINAAPDPRNANVTNVILLKQKWSPGHLAIEKNRALDQQFQCEVPSF